jgi:hypothetical protein
MNINGELPRTGNSADALVASGERPPVLTTADLAAMAGGPQRRAEEKDATLKTNTAPSAGQDALEQELTPLFDAGITQEFRSRWNAVQQGFVDDPIRAVQEGDELVAQVIKGLAESFAQQREGLEDKDGATEDLRVAFRRYRSFFDRLLSV